jgi:predicted O-methyltransferase YrrM
MLPKIQKILESLAKNKSKYWNISPETGQFLNDFILSHDIKSVLEIGTSTGYSGIWIAEALSHTNGHLFTMESHKERFALGEESFKKSGLSPFITHIFGHAPEKIPENILFDLAFFDATKYEHISYFEKIKTQIHPGGFLIADNFLSHNKELSSFLDHLKSYPNLKTSEELVGSGLLIVYFNSKTKMA